MRKEAAAAASPTSTAWELQMKQKKPDMLSSKALILNIRNDDEIHDILQNHPHPPPAISPANVQDLLRKLIMAGLLPAAAAPPADEQKEKAKPGVEVKAKMEGMKEEKKLEEKKIIPPLVETVDVSWDKLKEQRDKLISQICTGIQCGSRGLRFPPDQNVRSGLITVLKSVCGSYTSGSCVLDVIVLFFP